ncbi:uncharacterized protein LOC132045417 [Lycium ferocissimum]|uniref:uncharacterized protein LOC132045417 n=1 Tax=Lycium ferocissimum TaxID=112874 RepID=UPI002815F569|nr:uncharacterized protein LOC132045417 [Lycium ferocissimum]
MLLTKEKLVETQRKKRNGIQLSIQRGNDQPSSSNNQQKNQNNNGRSLSQEHRVKTHNSYAVLETEEKQDPKEDSCINTNKESGKDNDKATKSLDIGQDNGIRGTSQIGLTSSEDNAQKSAHKEENNAKEKVTVEQTIETSKENNRTEEEEPKNHDAENVDNSESDDFIESIEKLEDQHYSENNKDEENSRSKKVIPRAATGKEVDEQEKNNLELNIDHIAKEADLSPKQISNLKHNNSKVKRGKPVIDTSVPVRILPKRLTVSKYAKQ